MSGLVSLSSAALSDFWTERHLCTFTTLRKDGSPHVVAVGATLLGDVARVISSAGSAHVRHIRNGQARVAICQVDGARWSTVEGLAVVKDDPVSVAEGEKLYAARYRVPRPNPIRVVIEISVTKVLGSSAFTG
ncbi:PPOX class probable F420-dependent enzyme [Actinoplanes tereljensis]|uniref:PPOX class F420-dependent enzyme n=1 Tax=Paractinoplanes tereljensis TaxID=571912 RepID=A0A919NVD2_9ACTN|nr:pyridoxamine 5'-phosphate oxidase family protein [Actinoplanes tereljensis]GIF25870.1 PPOX class F420-dependent enzyme [Actinoplanes tereljensis]